MAIGTICHSTLGLCYLLFSFTWEFSLFHRDFECGLFSNDGIVHALATLRDGLNTFCIMKWTWPFCGSHQKCSPKPHIWGFLGGDWIRDAINVQWAGRTRLEEVDQFGPCFSVVPEIEVFLWLVISSLGPTNHGLNPWNTVNQNKPLLNLKVLGILSQQ